MSLSPEEVERKIEQVRTDRIGQLRNLIQHDPDEDMVPMVDMLAGEAHEGVEELRAEVDGLVAQDRFDLMQEVFNVADEYEEVHERAQRWKQSAHRGSTRVTEEAQGRELEQQEAQRRLEEEAKQREQQEALRRRERETRQREQQDLERRREDEARQSEQQDLERRREEETRRREAEERRRIGTQEMEQQSRREQEALRLRREEEERCRRERELASQRESEERFDRRRREHEDELRREEEEEDMHRHMMAQQGQEQEQADRRRTEKRRVEAEQTLRSTLQGPTRHEADVLQWAVDDARAADVGRSAPELLREGDRALQIARAREAQEAASQQVQEAVNNPEPNSRQLREAISQGEFTGLNHNQLVEARRKLQDVEARERTTRLQEEAEGQERRRVEGERDLYRRQMQAASQGMDGDRLHHAVQRARAAGVDEYECQEAENHAKAMNFIQRSMGVGKGPVFKAWREKSADRATARKALEKDIQEGAAAEDVVRKVKLARDAGLEDSALMRGADIAMKRRRAHDETVCALKTRNPSDLFRAQDTNKKAGGPKADRELLLRAVGNCTEEEEMHKSLAEGLPFAVDEYHRQEAERRDTDAHKIAGTRAKDKEWQQESAQMKGRVERAWDWLRGQALSEAAAPVSTTLVKSAPSGSKILQVESDHGFDRGMRVLVGAGTSREERHVVTGFGSLLVERPLQFGHERGEKILEDKRNHDPASQSTIQHAVTPSTRPPQTKGPGTGSAPLRPPPETFSGPPPHQSPRNRPPQGGGWPPSGPPPSGYPPTGYPGYPPHASYPPLPSHPAQPLGYPPAGCMQPPQTWAPHWVPGAGPCGFPPQSFPGHGQGFQTRQPASMGSMDTRNDCRTMTAGASQFEQPRPYEDAAYWR